MEIGKKYKGLDGSITVFENRIEITDKKLLSVDRDYGVKIIFISQISAVQLMRPKMFSNGAIQFVFPGSEEQKHIGFFARNLDENTITFEKKQLEIFTEIKDFIVSKK